MHRAIIYVTLKSWNYLMYSVHAGLFDNLNMNLMKSKGDVGFIWAKIIISL
jgi:hypothetical protein